MAPSPTHSPTPERTALEDPDTAAARKELRQTAISEKPDSFAMTATSDDAPDTADLSGKAASPEPIASPKKKRAHDDVDGPKDVTASADVDGDVSPIGSNGSASLNRAIRSEPAKKRPRDVSSESKADSTTASVRITTLTSEDASKSSEKEKEDESSLEKPATEKAADAQNDKSPKKNSGTTTASAFKSSSMSSFATQASPFLQAGTGQTLSSFANPSAAKSPFALSASTSKSIFNGSGGSSPFGQVASTSTSFGTGTFGGFGSSLGGSRLAGFGKPGESLKSGKPAKPFGAPASDDEGEGDDEEDGNASENDKEDSENRDAAEDKAVEAEDKRKTKLQRVVVDDGEAGEATILQVRGKLYNLDKTSNSWKERGAGNLKINAPMACIRTDGPEAGTFDASTLKDAESKVVRLVMRQDSTHRVILNTAIIPAMKFQEKSSLKATYILFTAIGDEGATSVQIKMNAANAKSFLNEVESVQLQLQSV
ncbi:hypothetical protein F4777DRAFT_230059 [Nemania sp. FL0916]|nr:hypothetical protein F4777DRAFT_230059 [Nemania sp. FL0916]